mgnify:CR=1 FL=1
MTTIVTTNKTNVTTTAKTVVTHNGLFHADEGFGVAFLSLLLGSEVRVVRTRNPQVIEEACVALDVGGVYDNAKLLYDHHQRDFTEVHEDTSVKLASCGLIWRHFGTCLITKLHPELDIEQIQSLWQTVDETICRPVDMQDNGQNTFKVEGAEAQALTISMMVSSFNQQDIYSPAQDEAFMRVVEILKEYVLNFLRAGANKLQLLKEAEEAVKAQLGSKVLVLDKFLPYREAVLKANAEGQDFCLVTYPAKNQWNVQTIPFDDSEANYYSQRVSFPKRVWGLTGPEAAKEQLGGCPLVFCHKTGFLAAIKADSADAARKAAEAVIAEAQAKA